MYAPRGMLNFRSWCHENLVHVEPIIAFRMNPLKLNAEA